MNVCIHISSYQRDSLHFRALRLKNARADMWWRGVVCVDNLNDGYVIIT